MAKLKRGKFSAEEKEVILASARNNVTVPVLSKLFNRSEKSIKDLIDNYTAVNTAESKDVSSIPDPPKPKDPGYARKHFEIPDGKNPGEKRKGISIMTTAGSEAGDEFLKADKSEFFPVSSRHKNCMVRAENGNIIN